MAKRRQKREGKLEKERGENQTNGIRWKLENVGGGGGERKKSGAEMFPYMDHCSVFLLETELMNSRSINAALRK